MSDVLSMPSEGHMMTFPQTVSILTNGCSEALKYSIILKRFFSQNGASITEEYDTADLIIFYACGLTATSREHSTQFIQELRNNRKKGGKSIVWGCLPKIDPSLVRSLGQDTIVGPLDLHFFDRIAPEDRKTTLSQIENSFSSHLLWEDRLLSRNRANEDLFSRAIQVNHFIDNRVLAIARMTLRVPFVNRMSTALFENTLKNRLIKKLIKKCDQARRGSLYIPIATGCRNHCTYCAEKQVYGSTKSRDQDAILAEFEHGLQMGYHHFSLIATDLSAYGIDIGSSLPELLDRMLDAGARRKFYIFLNQAEPYSLFSCFNELKQVLMSEHIVGLNCPVQSGSDRMLKLMGRRYKAHQWRETMLTIQRMNKGIRLTTHLLVGFPTESDDDVEMTVRLFEPPLVIHGMRTFRYNENSKLPASRIRGKIPEEIKVQRCVAIQRRYAMSFARNVISGT